MDPSLTHWGTAEGQLCLSTGVLDSLKVDMAITAKGKEKQVRVNSDDLQRCQILAEHAFGVGHRAKIVFIECPVGSQSANAMKSCGVSHGIVGSMRANGIQVIELTAKAIKKAMTGDPLATKAAMIDAAVAFYPDAGWKYHLSLIHI